MPQTLTADIRTILDPLPVAKEVKAAAWDAFHSARNDAEFRIKFAGINLPKETKASLWDAKGFTPEQLVTKITSPLKPVGPQMEAEAMANRPKDAVKGMQQLTEQQGKQVKGFARYGPELALAAVTAGASLPVQMGAGALIGGIEGGPKGAAIGAAVPGLGALASKIPSMARAGGKFEQVMSKAKDVPIDTGAADDAALRAMELRTRGSTLPKVLNDYIKNRQAATQPMTFEAGRDFASNAGALSSREATSLNAKMHRQVAEFAAALKTANREAAVKAGMGDLYDAAVKEYRRAATLKEAQEVLKKWGARVAITAGLGAAAAQGYELWKSH